MSRKPLVVSLSLALVPLAFLALAVGRPRPAQAQYQYNVTVGNITPQLWLPPGVTKVKGLLVFTEQMKGTEWANSADFRAMAARVGAGVVLMKGGNLFGAYPDRCKMGEFNYLLDAFTKLATMSNHPELANAPFVGSGHSHGGDYWNWFNACHPERMIMVFCKSSGGVNYKGAALKTPVMYEIGMKDLNETGSGKPRAGMFANRSKGATMSLVLGPGEAHGDFGAGSLKMVLALMEAIFKLRVPADADGAAGPVVLNPIDEAAGPYWLGDNYSKDIAAYGMFAGDKNLTSFLPSEELATMWKAAGDKLPPDIKIPVGECGWCGNPKDEPPASSGGGRDAGAVDAGVADGAPRGQDTAAPPGDEVDAGASPPADAAGTGTKPPAKKDAAAPDPGPDDPGEATPRGGSGCAVAGGRAGSAGLGGVALAALALRRRRRPGRQASAGLGSPS